MLEKAVQAGGNGGQSSAVKDRGALDFDPDLRDRWVKGLPSEVEYWDVWIRTKGHQWPKGFIFRTDPNAPLQTYMAGFLPPVRAIQGFAERLTCRFPPETFDLVFSRNAIDHSYRPDLAIEDMIKVAKRNRYVILGHSPNEGRNEQYFGLHQWDFTRGEDGSFIIKSPYQEINITKKFSPKARIRCEIRQEKSLSDKEFLLTEIFKL